MDLLLFLCYLIIMLLRVRQPYDNVCLQQQNQHNCSLGGALE